MISYKDFITHLIRVRIFEIGKNAKPNENEVKKLESQDVNNPVVQSYYVWRRSCLLVSCPILFVSMILSIINLVRTFSGAIALNALGYLLVFLSEINTTILFGTVSYAVTHWAAIKKSMYAVRIGWLISFIMPLLPALFPLEMIMKSSELKLYDNAAIISFKVSLALGYALTLLPVTVTFPGGAVRASLRIRWLLPDSFVAGWILVLCAPFYSIVVCIALIIVMQVVGNGVLFVGMLLIVVAPWGYVYRANYFAGYWSTEEMKDRVRIAQKIITAMTLVGYLLFMLWAFTAEVSGIKPIGNKYGDTSNTDDDSSNTDDDSGNTDDDSSNTDDAFSDESETVYLMSYGEGILMILELFGRMLVTTILFSDAILRLTLRNWINENNRRSANGCTMDDVDFKAFLENFPLNSNNAFDTDSESVKKSKKDETTKNDIESNQSDDKKQKETNNFTEPYDETELTMEVEKILQDCSDFGTNNIDKKCVAEILGENVDV